MKTSYIIKLYIAFVFLAILQTQAQNTSGNWKVKGPIAFPTNISGQIHGIGRVSQVKFHATNQQKMYAVSASGGLWITNDGAQTWSKTNTDAHIPQGSCSAVAVDPTNDNIIYLSTGDANYYASNYGIYKSINGGQTWSASNNGIGDAMAVEILISPTNHNTILAATNNGIWKSTNAGATWTLKTNGTFRDMVYKPGSSTTVYAVTANQFLKSTNEGDTWTVIASATPVAGNGGRLAVTEANPNIVYVGYVGSNNADKGGIIYQSTDSGTTFTLKKGDVQPNLNGYEANETGQGAYNWGLWADRVNSNILYACGHVVWKSTDSGATWTQLTNWWENCHTDMHQMISSPFDNTKLYNSNDGGVFISTDGGNVWNPTSNGISATEVYHMGQSKLARNIVTIGTQDNGEIYLNNATWYCNRGGDWGSKASFDYANPNVAYYHENALKRDLVANDAETEYGITNPTNADTYVFSASNTSLAFVSKGAVLKKTTNLLAATPTWTNLKTFAADIKNVALSPTNNNEIYVVLTNGQVYYTSNGGVFTQKSVAPAAVNEFCTIEVNKSNTNIVYLTCGAKVYRSTNKGGNWTDISNGLTGANIISLVHNPYSTDESFYLATPFGVYYKNATMSNWQSFSTGLPLIAQITDLFGYFDGTTNSVLRVSFYGRGVWESDLYSTTLSDDDFDIIKGNISVYPNPSTDIITIDVTIPELINTQAQLLDTTGKVIKAIDITQPTLLVNFAHLAKGVYFLKFKNNTVKRVVFK